MQGSSLRDLRWLVFFFLSWQLVLFVSFLAGYYNTSCLTRVGSPLACARCKGIGASFSRLLSRNKEAEPAGKDKDDD